VKTRRSLLTVAVTATLLCAACGSATSAPGGTTADPSATAAGSQTSVAGGSASPAAQVAAPVPAQYQQAYSTLQGQVSAFAAVAEPGPATSATVISSALEPADGNAMHPGILQGSALQTSITMISGMRAMGETGVTVQVSFPLLLSSFPDSSEYLSFYRQVAAAVHQQGMTLTVEENPLFPNMSGLPVSGFYAGLDLQSFAADYQQQAETIITAMQPRYLSFLNEPDTYTANLHNPSIRLTDPVTGVEFVNLVLGGLDRQGTSLCAGSGTWQDASYDQALLDQTSIDCLDLHMYPVAAQDVSNLQAEVTAAEVAHRPVVMSECWLYKQSTDGRPVDSVTSAPDEQKDGTFSFWEPLDSAFLTAMVDYARGHGFAVASPFSTENFFAYQAWTPALEAETPTQARQSFNLLVSQALKEGQLSSLGSAFAGLARS